MKSTAPTLIHVKVVNYQKKYKDICSQVPNKWDTLINRGGSEKILKCNKQGLKQMKGLEFVKWLKMTVRWQKEKKQVFINH